MYAVESCGGTVTDVSGYFYYNWSTGSTQIATVDAYGTHTGVAVGSTTSYTSGDLNNNSQIRKCPIVVFNPSGNDKVTPTIMLGGCSGTNITNTTQSVVVGQQIVLCASYTLPSGVSVTSQSWTVPGTVVASFVPSSSSSSLNTAVTLNQQSTTFYWVYPGNPQVVTFTLNLSNGQSPTAQATFNVTGPTGGTMTNSAYSQVTIANLASCVVGGQNFPAAPWLAYGNITGSCASISGTYGIVFNSPTGYSNASGGSFSLVQLISSNSLSGSYNHTFTANLDPIGYPYGTGLPSNDSPIAQLLSTYTTLTRSFNANMFLMWTPPAATGCSNGSACTIPVPLGYQTWAFSGSANCSTGCGSAANWTATTNGTPGPVGNFAASLPSQTAAGNNILVYGIPTWTGVSQ